MSKLEELRNRSPRGGQFPGKPVAEALEKYQLDNSLNRTEMAQLLGVSPQRYGNLINKTPARIQASTLIKIEDKLGIPMDVLVKTPYSQQTLDTYPNEVLEWIVSPEGRQHIMEGYTAAQTKLFKEKIEGTLGKVANYEK